MTQRSPPASTTASALPEHRPYYRDITAVRARRDQLAQIVADPLAPPIRHQRDKTELERLEAVLRAHDVEAAS
jgi:hypothetical protein